MSKTGDFHVNSLDPGVMIYDHLVNDANDRAVLRFGARAFVIPDSMMYWTPLFDEWPYAGFEHLPQAIADLNEQMTTTIRIELMRYQFDGHNTDTHCLVIMPQTDMDALAWRLSGL